MDVAHRLFAPALRNRGTDGAPHGLADRVGIPSASTRQGFDCLQNGVIDGVVHRFPVPVALAVTDKGELVDDPSLDLIGIPERDREGGSMHEIVRDAILETVESLPRGRRRDPDAVAEAVRRAVRAAIAQRWGKKPMCHVHVLTI